MAEFLTGDSVEHVFNVEGDEGTGREEALGFWDCDKFVDAKGHSVGDEVEAAADAEGEIEGEEVICKSAAVDVEDGSSGNASNGRWDPEGAKFVGVVYIFVEENLVSSAKKVDDAWGDIAVGDDREKCGEGSWVDEGGGGCFLGAFVK